MVNGITVAAQTAQDGFGGIDLMRASAGGWAAAGEAMLATGVTAYRPTVITAPEDEMAAALASAAEAAETAKAVAEIEALS